MYFQEANDYLLSLGNEVSAMKLGLENIRRLLGSLGDPQTQYLKVQVAGTNGKGSVCAFMRSICLEAGIKAGVYTSPHLVSITERINIGGVDISEDEFALAATEVRKMSEALAAAGVIDGIPTFFEQVTAIALLAFAEADVDVAILETGLGGRLDATTAADAEIVAITRIDLDHQDILGETLSEIAAEKAAIIRSGTTAVLCRQGPEAEEVLKQRCRTVSVEPFWTPEKTDVRSEPVSGPLLFVTFQTDRQNYPTVALAGMLGRHQVENASVALRIAEVLQDRGLAIDLRDIWTGLSNARHSGRLEVYDGYLLDGAHNLGGARALRDFMNEFIHDHLTVIFGASQDKDVGQIAEVLFPSADNLILTRSQNPRAMSPDQILGLLSARPQNVLMTGSVAEAMDLAEELRRPDGLVLITGSLYLVGEAKRILEDRYL